MIPLLGNVVRIADGQCGYAIIIEGAYERDDRLEVVVKSVINLKCGAVLTVVTSPKILCDSLR
jgi:hypothetical protein